VLEGSFTRFLEGQKGVGVDRMASVGVGIEFDASARLAPRVGAVAAPWE